MKVGVGPGLRLPTLILRLGLVTALLGAATGPALAQTPPAPPTGLLCELQPGAIVTTQLSWQNPESYLFLEVRRNGLLIATLPGGSTAHDDIGVPVGTQNYAVRGVIALPGGESLCSLLVPPNPVEPDILPPPSLTTMEVPRPSNLIDFVASEAAAIELGKAFFWDMQAGGDGVQACASCHFHAGADSRVVNQLSPGLIGGDTTFQVAGPNHRLTTADFPYHQLVDPEDQGSFVLFDANDVTSSAGVINRVFNDVIPGEPSDVMTVVPDPVFQVGGTNTRKVEPRNTPTVINAVFFIENFWDGRASFFFNGRNPFGFRDPDARVLKVEPDGSVIQTAVLLDRASLASQAVGPPLSDFEMGSAGRTFMKMGKKVLSLQPLALQAVHPNDSVLGPLASPGGNGLVTDYVQMIQAAFKPEWWDSDRLFDAALNEIGAGVPASTDEFTMMEANFSLFWGLAIQLYEGTLVSDDSPYDRFQDGDPSALSAHEQQGMSLFTQSSCILCHNTAVFSPAISAVLTTVQEPEAGTLEGIVERMPMLDLVVSVYDLGFYNIGVRPTAEDIGRGGTDPFGNPLSFTGYVQLFGPDLIPFAPNTLIINPPVEPWEPVAMGGSFKTPSLRNVELTGPYFHNGSQATLDQVLDFYARGGDFGQLNIDNTSPFIRPLPLFLGNEQNQQDVIAFIEALTDERVRWEMAPFDHPQIFLTRGAVGDELAVAESAPGSGFSADVLVELPAVGAAGRAAEGLPPLRQFLQPAQVENLACADTGGGIQLTWTNGDVYPLIRVERDGALIVILPGNQEQYVDAFATAPAAYQYSITGVDGPLSSFSVECTGIVPPLPVTNLACNPVLSGVALTWTNNGSYSSVEIERNGMVIGTVGGGVTAFLDDTAGSGLQQYAVRGVTSGAPSPPAECAVPIPPAPLTGLSCVSDPSPAVSLSWMNGDPYDVIEVERNGAPLASLPGTESVFLDAAPPFGLNEYVLRGRLDGLPSEDVLCAVPVPPAGVQNLSCGFIPGGALLSWLNAGPYSGIEISRDGASLAIIPGTETSFLDATAGAAGSGLHSYSVMPLVDGVPGPLEACFVGVPPSPISDLACAVAGSDITLSWTNGEAYDEIRIERDGAPLVTLPGSATLHVDSGVAAGQHSYQVTAVKEGILSTGVSCGAGVAPASVASVTCSEIASGILVSWVNTDPYDGIEIHRNGVFLVSLAGFATSYVDLAAPSGVDEYSVVGIVDGVAAPGSSCSFPVPPPPVLDLLCELTDPCLYQGQVGWTNAEPYDSLQLLVNGILTLNLAGDVTAAFLNLGAPGSYEITLLGSVQGVVSDPASCILDALEVPATPVSQLGAVVDGQSCEATLTWTNESQYGELRVLVDGLLVATLPGDAAGANVALGGPGTFEICVEGTTICGATVPASCVSAECGTRFKRGDCNGDGLLDISDAIFLTGYIFLGTSAPTCDDSCDANDDGFVDIGDVIYDLQLLFNEGPPPPAPYPHCGLDATPADNLECDTYPPCP